eukprot:PLAT5349.1.p1 GENE.PLAT5349.1~~PLAT5349.1.p1  ORF type:complete len:1477 (+),score=587.10 PLAT5349.1:493-4431(+)
MPGYRPTVAELMASVPPTVDMNSFPILRLDQLPLLPEIVLREASLQLTELIASSTSGATPSLEMSLLAYCFRERDAIDASLAAMSASVMMPSTDLSSAPTPAVSAPAPSPSTYPTAGSGGGAARRVSPRLPPISHSSVDISDSDSELSSHAAVAPPPPPSTVAPAPATARTSVEEERPPMKRRPSNIVMPEGGVIRSFVVRNTETVAERKRKRRLRQRKRKRKRKRKVAPEQKKELSKLELRRQRRLEREKAREARMLELERQRQQRRAQLKQLRAAAAVESVPPPPPIADDDDDDDDGGDGDDDVMVVDDVHDTAAVHDATTATELSTAASSAAVDVSDDASPAPHSPADEEEEKEEKEGGGKDKEKHAATAGVEPEVQAAIEAVQAELRAIEEQQAELDDEDEADEMEREQDKRRAAQVAVAIEENAAGTGDDAVEDVIEGGERKAGLGDARMERGSKSEEDGGEEERVEEVDDEEAVDVDRDGEGEEEDEEEEEEDDDDDDDEVDKLVDAVIHDGDDDLLAPPGIGPEWEDGGVLGVTGVEVGRWRPRKRSRKPAAIAEVIEEEEEDETEAEDTEVKDTEAEETEAEHTEVEDTEAKHIEVEHTEAEHTEAKDFEVVETGEGKEAEEDEADAEHEPPKSPSPTTADTPIDSSAPDAATPARPAFAVLPDDVGCEEEDAEDAGGEEDMLATPSTPATLVPPLPLPSATRAPAMMDGRTLLPEDAVPDSGRVDKRYAGAIGQLQLLYPEVPDSRLSDYLVSVDGDLKAAAEKLYNDMRIKREADIASARSARTARSTHGSSHAGALLSSREEAAEEAAAAAAMEVVDYSDFFSSFERTLTFFHDKVGNFAAACQPHLQQQLDLYTIWAKAMGGCVARRLYKVMKTRAEVYMIVTDQLQAVGDWDELPTGLGLKTTWNLLWSWSRPKVNRSTLFTWQLVNHFPDNRMLTRKDNLCRQLARYRKRGGRLAEAFDILPPTFILPGEYLPFTEAFRAGQDKYGERNFWIVKPVSMSRGRGISLINDIGDLSYGDAVVIQRYLHRPLLLDGYKFDLRLYVLVTSFSPLEAFLYKEGFARLSTRPYSMDPEHMKDKFVHLTNSSIQKFNTSVEVETLEKATLDEAGGTKLSLSYLLRRLSEQGIDVNLLWQRIVDVVVKSLVAVDDSISASVNSFEVYGYDVLIDTDLRAWLIEVNSSPSMGCDSSLDSSIKEAMIADTMTLLDPLPFDREALIEILERRIEEMEEHRRRPYVTSLTTPQQALNADLTRILRGRKPRQYGEMPAQLGAYQRICPGTRLYKQAMKLKRKGFRKAPKRR